jgi:prolyl-tRNA synthetase
MGFYIVNLGNFLAFVLFERAKDYYKKMTYSVDSYDELKKTFAGSGTGFVYAHWCGSAKCEEQVKEDTSATIRCIALINPKKKANVFVVVRIRLANA